MVVPTDKMHAFSIHNRPLRLVKNTIEFIPVMDHLQVLDFPDINKIRLHGAKGSKFTARRLSTNSAMFPIHGMKMVIPFQKKFMDVIIQSLGFKAGEELENYVREKLDKLKPSDHIVRANVVLYLGPDRATPNTYCEIRLEVPGNDLFVKEHSAEFEQSVDAAVNILQGMLRKQKEKQLDQWHGRANT